MKALFLSVIVLLAGCAQTSHKSPETAPTATTAQPQYLQRTHNADGTTVERIKLREPILSQQGIIVLVVRIKNVPGSPHVVFYVPCYADGGCTAQPVPGEPRSVVTPDGEVITVSNTTPDTTHWKRWTPPPGEHI